MQRCKCQNVREKPKCPSFSNMLTPFHVVRNSNSKLFGGLNLIKCLMMQGVVEVNLIARKGL